MTCCINVKEKIAHIIFAIRCHIMVDELRILSSEICIREYQHRTLGFITAHCKDACLCVLTWLTDTVVILLLISEFEGIHLITAFSSNILRSNLLKLDKVSRLRAKEESSLSRNGDVINIAHRSLSLHCRIIGYRTSIRGYKIALFLMCI